MNIYFIEIKKPKIYFYSTWRKNFIFHYLDEFYGFIYFVILSLTTINILFNIFLQKFNF